MEGQPVMAERAAVTAEEVLQALVSGWYLNGVLTAHISRARFPVDYRWTLQRGAGEVVPVAARIVAEVSRGWRLKYLGYPNSFVSVYVLDFDVW